MRQVLENRYIEPSDLHALLKRLFGAGNYEVDVGDPRSLRYPFDILAYKTEAKREILGKEE